MQVMELLLVLLIVALIQFIQALLTNLSLQISLTFLVLVRLVHISHLVLAMERLFQLNIFLLVLKLVLPLMLLWIFFHLLMQMDMEGNVGGIKVCFTYVCVGCNINFETWLVFVWFVAVMWHLLLLEMLVFLL
jgi:hypothetical protein